MDKQERDKRYNEYVDAKIPNTKNWPTLFYAFIVGGTICSIGQGIYDIFASIFPTMTETELSAWMLVILIFITCLLTALGVYDKVGEFGGAGSIVPITGFANSIVAPAMEFNKEGIILGTMAKMFVIAGPIIVSAIVYSVLSGLIFYFIGVI